MAIGQSMIVKVRVFAGLQHMIGQKTVEVTVPEGATVSALKDRLAEDFPVLDAFMNTYVIAVDEEVQDGAHVLRPGQLVDLIPPIAGG